MTNHSDMDVVRIREEILPWFQELRDAALSYGEIPVLASENYDIVPRNSFTVSQRTFQDLDTSVPGKAPAMRYNFGIWNFSWRRIIKQSCKMSIVTGCNSWLCRWSRRCRTKTSSARMTSTFKICQNKLVYMDFYSGEKGNMSQPSDSYIILIMNSQSRTRAAPAPSSYRPSASVSDRWRLKSE